MRASSSDIEIRQPSSPAEYRAIQDAQRKVWGITEEGYILPVATMVGAHHHGGLVIGAFLPNGEVVGFSFSFIGRIAGELCLYSQITGVVPNHQGDGIGARLKWYQWEFARNNSIPSIAWAFDPFQTGNAHFNLRMLRARSRRYLEDMYGPRSDAINAGIPTDRLIAEWSTAVDPREHHLPELQIENIPRLFETRYNESGLVTVTGVRGTDGVSIILLEVPEKIQLIQATAAGEAERWRSALRQGFHAAFHDGYIATDFVRDTTDRTRCYYRLDQAVAR